MKTMKAAIISASIFVVTTLSITAHADAWECSAGSGSTSDAVCYVQNVRFYAGANPYVRAKIYDPENDTACEYIRFRLNSGADSMEAVRGAESMLLTALTTGLPIKFYTRTAYGNSADCYGATLFVSKPGH